jgi:hypothetical protein
MEEDTDNKAKIIDLVQRLREKQDTKKGGRSPGPLGATKARIRQIKAMAKEVIAEGAQDRLTEQEREFVDLVVNGDSYVGAYEQAYPEKCFEIVLDCRHKGDEPCVDACETVRPILSYEQKYTKANSLSKKVDVRSSIMLGLAQEEDDVSHTASRLDNFIVKRLEKEAKDQSNSASARIAALKALSEHRAVQAAESRAGEKAAATSEEVLNRIQARVNELSPSKGKL